VIDGVSTMGTPQADIASSAIKGGQMGKQEFLQLLVTQLRNQDPLNPSDPQEFAAQLAQFSTLEQLVNIGDQLKESAASDQALIQMFNSSSALTLIGKSIVAEGNGVAVPQTGDVNVIVGVGGSGGAATVRLFDGAGKEIGSMPLGQLGAGRQTIDLSQLTAGQPAGDYTYALEVTDAQGAAVASQTYTAVRVDGVKYTSDGPVLVCGNQTIALNAVVEISN
jgi:flagellar basal-body rod modification protein FlgD